MANKKPYLSPKGKPGYILVEKPPAGANNMPDSFKKNYIGPMNPNQIAKAKGKGKKVA